jgi:hypothetical protein
MAILTFDLLVVVAVVVVVVVTELVVVFDSGRYEEEGEAVVKVPVVNLCSGLPGGKLAK